MARCLGRGPLPMRELLASPEIHADRCVSGVCAASEGSGTPAGTY
jgi:hypothetical protein